MKFLGEALMGSSGIPHVTCVRFLQVFGSTPAGAALPQLRSSIARFPVPYRQLLLEQTQTQEPREEPI